MNTEHKRVNGIHPTNEEIKEAITHANKYHCKIVLEYMLHNIACSLMIREGDTLESIMNKPFAVIAL